MADELFKYHNVVEIKSMLLSESVGLDEAIRWVDIYARRYPSRSFTVVKTEVKLTGPIPDLKRRPRDV